MTFIDALQQRDTYTENGAITNSTSLSKCLDYFFVAGNPRDYTNAFTEAFRENPTIALKILFWSRDIRMGAGARKTFDMIIPAIQENAPRIFSNIYKSIPEMGYWKDVFKLKPTPELVKYVFETLQEESDHSLCAKYCPRKGWWFAELLKYANTIYPTTQKDFRHWIVGKSTTVEQQMCDRDWENIQYEHVPSVAGSKYRRTFKKHDSDRYTSYLEDVAKGKKKINSSTLYPHNIFDEWLEGNTDPNLIRGQWNALPNLMEGCKERILPLCDVSGSMSGTPMSVSVALGCYISQHNEGIFKDAFMTFSEHPTLEYLRGDDIISRFEQLHSAEWGGNTNLQAAFDVILTQAVKNNVPASEMPTKLLIISDMEFDEAIGNGLRRMRRWMGMMQEPDDKYTNLDVIKEKYKAAGYELPEIVFWNVNGRAGNVPASMTDEKIGLVSGYSPNNLRSILKGIVPNPYQLMLDTVDTERYKDIHV